MPGALVVGTLMIDIVAPLVSGLQPGANYTVGIDSCHGGGGGNVAYHLAKAGAMVALASGLGDDPLGRAYEERLRGLGVRLYLARGGRTGMLVALTYDGGERTFLADPGANTLITPGLARAVIEDTRPLVTVVHGYLLASPQPRRAAVEAARVARSLGSVVVFDPGYYNMGPQELEAARRILESSDIIVPNEDEARALAGTRDPVEAAQALARTYNTMVYLKMGEKGAMLVTRDKAEHVPPPRVEVANTVGSGDAFTAMVAYGVLQGWTPSTTLREATRLASHVATCRCPQCTPGEG